MDKKCLMIHKAKVKKLFTETSPETKSIEMRRITKDHLYSQVGGKSNAVNAKKFISGLEKHGLGKVETIEGEACFKLIDFENATPAEIEFCNELGVINNDM